MTLAKIWTRAELAYIKKHWERSTNKAIAKALGLNLTRLRMKVYSMGLRRMELEYWTDEQVKFLKANYKQIGDKELAIIFNKKWKKVKRWSHKHIEKKRRYLKLIRTDRQKRNIHQRNVDRGAFLLCPVKRWLTTGQAKEKEVRMWREQSGRFTPRIKINGRFVHWNRYMWETHIGKIPKGMNVVFKDNNPQNQTLKNLEIVSNSELARRNVIKASQNLSDNYIAGILSNNNRAIRDSIKKNPELIQQHRSLLLLKRKIKAFTYER